VYGAALVLIFLLNDTPGAVLMGILMLIHFLVLTWQLGKKRRSEIEDIRKTIFAIRNNLIATSDKIQLHPGLESLEEEIKEMFIRVQADIGALEKLEKVRTQFLANVSHELKTPIFAITGFLETLLNGALYDEKVNASFLKKAYDHTINLSNLLSDLIDLSMIESGEMRMSFRYFNVNEYMQAIVQEFQPIAEQKGLTLQFTPVRQNLQLFGDKNRIRQVMTNLISNAVKYSEQGGVEIVVEEESKYATIRVRDTGIGIPPEDQERIFERFYRIDKARSRDVGGTGLGLAIVKHIVDAHGSRTNVVSEPGKGTEFSFRLKK